jgi:hypothetical protein
MLLQHRFSRIQGDTNLARQRAGERALKYKINDTFRCDFLSFCPHRIPRGTEIMTLHEIEQVLILDYVYLLWRANNPQFCSSHSNVQNVTSAACTFRAYWPFTPTFLSISLHWERGE